EREAVLKRRLDDRLNEKLREARAEVDRIVGRLREQADVLAREAETRAARGGVLSTGEIGGPGADARQALGAVAAALSTGEPGDGDQLDAPPAPGDRVFVASLKTEGIVRAAVGRRVEVDVRGLRLRTSTDDLRRPG